MSRRQFLGCRPDDHPRFGRRGLLQVGGMGLVGMGLSDLLRLEAQAAGGDGSRGGKAKSVVFIFQSGGPSQHETFDPKPHAPDTIRGEYGVVQSRVPGELFCEHLPKLSARSNRFSIVRTMNHIAGREFRNEHNSCFYLLHTGSTSLPVGDTNATIAGPRPGRISWPSIGSMVAYAAPTDASVGWPAMVELPRANGMKYPGRESGLLGPQFDRLGVDLAPKCHAPDAGGGIQPGRIIGRTDEQGGLPVTDAFTPEDLAATIFHCLGIGPDREFHDSNGRPYRVYRGQPIHALL